MEEIKDVVTEIRSGRSFTADLADKAAAELAKGQEGKKVKDLMFVQAEASYEKKRALLKLRKERDIESRITKPKLAKLQELENRVYGKVTPALSREDYNDEKDKVEEEFNKERRKVDAEFDTLESSLSNQYWSDREVINNYKYQ